MNGQLNEQPLVELIREIEAQRYDGVLRLRHDPVKVVVYFEAGAIIYAAANLRELRLAEYIRKQGLLSDEQLQSLQNNQSDLAFAAMLSQQGLIDQKTVIRLIANQVIDVLRVALLWTEGEWKFDARTRLDEPLRVKVDVPGLLLQATRKMQPEVIARRLPNHAEIFSPVSGISDSAALLPMEGFLFSRLEGPLSLGEWVSQSGLSQAEALRTIYGLALAGFAKRERDVVRRGIRRAVGRRRFRRVGAPRRRRDALRDRARHAQRPSAPARSLPRPRSALEPERRDA